MIQPPAGYTKFLALGVKRGNTTIPQIIVIGILAGWYIGFGMLLAMTCGMDTPDIAKVRPPALPIAIWDSRGVIWAVRIHAARVSAAIRWAAPLTHPPPVLLLGCRGTSG